MSKWDDLPDAEPILKDTEQPDIDQTPIDVPPLVMGKITVKDRLLVASSRLVGNVKTWYNLGSGGSWWMQLLMLLRKLLGR